jgi:hypothetical protein
MRHLRTTTTTTTITTSTKQKMNPSRSTSSSEKKSRLHTITFGSNVFKKRKNLFCAANCDEVTRSTKPSRMDD